MRGCLRHRGAFGVRIYHRKPHAQKGRGGRRGVGKQQFVKPCKILTLHARKDGPVQGAPASSSRRPRPQWRTRPRFSDGPHVRPTLTWRPIGVAPGAGRRCGRHAWAKCKADGFLSFRGPRPRQDGAASTGEGDLLRQYVHPRLLTYSFGCLRRSCEKKGSSSRHL